MKLKHAVSVIILALALAGCKSSTTGPGGGGLVGGGGGGGGGGGNASTLTISGNITNPGGETQFIVAAIFSHDQQYDQSDSEVDADTINVGNFHVAIQIPNGYGQNDYVMFAFVGTHCYDLDGDGQADDVFAGFYPDLDQQGNFRFTRIQSTYNGLNVDASYYIQDYCGGKGIFKVKKIKEVK